MNKSQKFTYFLESIKTIDTEILINDVKSAFIACTESEDSALIEGKFLKNLATTAGAIGIMAGGAFSKPVSQQPTEPKHPIENIMQKYTPQQFATGFLSMDENGQNTFTKMMLDIMKTSKDDSQKRYVSNAYKEIKKLSNQSDDGDTKQKSNDQKTHNKQTSNLKRSLNQDTHMYEYDLSVDSPDILKNAIERSIKMTYKDSSDDNVKKLIDETIKKVKPGQTKIAFQTPYYVE